MFYVASVPLRQLKKTQTQCLYLQAFPVRLYSIEILLVIFFREYRNLKKAYISKQTLPLAQSPLVLFCAKRGRGVV